MTRAALLIAIVLVCLTPRLNAVAYKCVLTNTCKPLPCEFMAELAASKARERVAARPLPVNLNSTEYKDEQVWWNRWFTEVDAINKKYRRCSAASQIPEVVVPMDDCRILDAQNRTEKTLDDLKRESSTCEELVEARYAAAEAEVVACVAFSRGKIWPVGALQQLKIMTTHARTKSLEASLTRYLRSCKPNAALSRQIDQAGLGALAKAAAKARIKWKTAKRAAK